MTVVLNEAAIAALLQAPEGPVMQEVERRAERARAALQTRIDGILDNPLIRPQAGVKMTPEGAEIGIINTQGRVDEYMDVKLGVRENWWLAVGEAAAGGS